MTVIELLLNAENLLDALGRTPAHLMPNEFKASEIALDALGRAPLDSRGLQFVGGLQSRRGLE